MTPPTAVPSFSVHLHHEDGWLRVVCEGTPGLADLCGASQLVATVAEMRGCRRALIDLVDTAPELSFTEHLQLGAHIAQSRARLDCVATVVSTANRTGSSEKAAQKNGLHLRTFTDPAEARQWIERKGAE